MKKIMYVILFLIIVIIIFFYFDNKKYNAENVIISQDSFSTMNNELTIEMKTLYENKVFFS